MIITSVTTLQLVVCTYWFTTRCNRNPISVWLSDFEQVSLVLEINLHNFFQSSHVVIDSTTYILQLVKIIHCAKSNFILWSSIVL